MTLFYESDFNFLKLKGRILKEQEGKKARAAAIDLEINRKQETLLEPFVGKFIKYNIGLITEIRTDDDMNLNKYDYEKKNDINGYLYKDKDLYVLNIIDHVNNRNEKTDLKKLITYMYLTKNENIDKYVQLLENGLYYDTNKKKFIMLINNTNKPILYKFTPDYLTFKEDLLMVTTNTKTNTTNMEASEIETIKYNKYIKELNLYIKEIQKSGNFIPIPNVLVLNSYQQIFFDNYTYIDNSGILDKSGILNKDKIIKSFRTYQLKSYIEDINYLPRELFNYSIKDTYDFTTINRKIIGKKYMLNDYLSYTGINRYLNLYVYSTLEEEQEAIIAKKTEIFNIIKKTQLAEQDKMDILYVYWLTPEEKKQIIKYRDYRRSQNEESIREKIPDILLDLVITYYIEKYQELIKPNTGGKSKTKRKSSKSKVPFKTNQKHKCNDGISRTVYKKNESYYVKRKSPKTGKLVYRKVKL
jgi:hypothetical protein